MFTRRQLFFRHVAQTSQNSPAIEIESAHGIYLHGFDGKKYIDLISGIAVSSLGHGNIEIINAIKQQLDKHLHLMVYGEYLVSPQVELATALSRHLPESLSSVYFTNSGTEATEGAMKLAKRFTGRPVIAGFSNSYHGSTQGALSIGGNEELSQAYRPLIPGILTLKYNSIKSLSSLDQNVAAVFIEPIQAEAGVILPEAEFMKELVKVCRKNNILLVFDEIQSGFGRTGSLFAFEQLKVVPDILLTGKAFGGGMPLGAFISSPEIMSALTHDPVLGHLTTFGGHPVSCAASMAALKILTESNIIKDVEAKELLFRSLLKHQAIKQFRGKGLMLSLQFETETFNKKLIDHLYTEGILTDWFLFAPDCLRLAPPLTISHDEIKMVCGKILAALDIVCR